ncbi:MAG: LytS/YhcK type 5TM receptor domain-containing protein [Lachnospiraceae bacterium]|nr:LytS/YhcK type 5TM receptor domain-containing protein [Lachnospiraceae bacterium]
MTLHLFISLLMNVSLLTLVATLLTRLSSVQKLLVDKSDWWSGNKVFLAVIFGLISILSTYTGSDVDGAILNTRVIGVLAGGMIGGPIVGIGSALIAGIHRYLFDVGGFTSVACAISTILEGIISTIVWFIYQKKDKVYTYFAIFNTAFIAECVQMLVILFVAKPYIRAFQLVNVIGIPMILFNSLGLVVFFSVFRYVMDGRDLEEARSIGLSLKIAEICLPHLRKMHRSKHDWDYTRDTILSLSDCLDVMVTTKNTIQISSSKYASVEEKDGKMPEFIIEAINTKKYTIRRMTQIENGKKQKIRLIAAPMIAKEEVIGVLVLFFSERNHSVESERGLTEGLASLFAVQLELSDLEYQKKMRRKAEYKALQSQINPHFLFNSLNTISYFCREKPERARELLLALSKYFRNTLEDSSYMIPLEKELSHVKAYLALAEARFEDRLKVDIEVNGGASCTVPNLIIQPLVENAIKHGAMKRAYGIVTVTVEDSDKGTVITVSDNGPGISSSIISSLYDGKALNGVGLENVHKRLISIYGENNGLKILSGSEGTKIVVEIPYEVGKEASDNFNTDMKEESLCELL